MDQSSHNKLAAEHEVQSGTLMHFFPLEIHTHTSNFKLSFEHFAFFRVKVVNIAIIGVNTTSKGWGSHYFLKTFSSTLHSINIARAQKTALTHTRVYSLFFTAPERIVFLFNSFHRGFSFALCIVQCVTMFFSNCNFRKKSLLFVQCIRVLPIFFSRNFIEILCIAYSWCKRIFSSALFFLDFHHLCVVFHAIGFDYVLVNSLYIYIVFHEFEMSVSSTVYMQFFTLFFASHRRHPCALCILLQQQPK